MRQQTQLKDTHTYIHTQNTAVNNCAATKNCCLLQTSFKVNAQIVERRLHARIKIGGIPMAIFKDSFQRMLANDATHEEHQRAIPQRNHNYCLCFFLCCTALATTCHCMNVRSPLLISPTIHFWFLLLSLLKMHPHNRLINSSLSRWTVELQFRRIFYFFFKISVWCRRETGKKLEFIRLPGENASNMNRYFVRNISK